MEAGDVSRRRGECVRSGYSEETAAIYSKSMRLALGRLSLAEFERNVTPA